MLMRKFSILFLSLFSIFACSQWSPPEAPPASVTATQDETDKITVTWSTVSGAGVYHIYRSEAENGEYEYIDSTAAASYVDTDIDFAVPYWYKIQAADPTGKIETPLSEPVNGIADHVYEWDTSIITSGVSGFRFHIDGRRNAFAVTAGSGEEGPVTVYGEEENGNWEQLGEPVGAVYSSGGFGGTGPAGLFSISGADGIPAVAYADGRRDGKISAAVYSDEEWTDLGSPEFGTGSIMNLQLVAGTAGSYYIAYIDGGRILIYQYNDTDWQILDSLPADTAVNWFEILTARDGKITLTLYSAGSDPASGSDDRVRLYTFDGQDWVNEGEISSGIIPDGYIDAAAGNDGQPVLTAFFSEEEGLQVHKFTEDQWLHLGEEFPIDAYPAADTAALGYEDETVYLFYRENEEYRGIITELTDSGWTVIPLSEDDETVTGAFSVSSFSLEIEDTRIYAGYMEGGSALIRVYR
ncbi:MAG: hypothetical protein ACLFST_15525 [Spirochaetia bacterium]